MTAGDQLQVNGLEISAVATRHDNGRWKKHTSPECVGYVVAAAGKAVHHAGDVDFSDHAIFDDIGKHFAIDATLLPIGGMMRVGYYRKRRHLIDQGVHIDPDCALDIYERLGARNLVPVHWGTLHLPFLWRHAPKKRLAEIVAERGARNVAILAHREKLAL
jgi:L-ascorbate metabolism protein UlaG (beta-lactamase superfamily)